MNNTYLYLLEVFATDEDGNQTDKIVQVEAFSEESLLEQLRKVDSSKAEYEGRKEAEAQAEYDRQKDEGEV